MPGLILIGLPAAGVPFQQEDIELLERFTPVDTGWLQSRYQITADGFAIQNDADYAAYVEFGHHTTSGSVVDGQFFMHDALPDLLQQMYERESEILENYELYPGEFEIFVGY